MDCPKAKLLIPVYSIVSFSAPIIWQPPPSTSSQSTVLVDINREDPEFNAVGEVIFFCSQYFLLFLKKRLFFEKNNVYFSKGTPVNNPRTP